MEPPELQIGDDVTADMPITDALAAIRARGPDTWPVADHEGHAIGLLGFQQPAAGTDEPTPALQ